MYNPEVKHNHIHGGRMHNVWDLEFFLLLMISTKLFLEETTETTKKKVIILSKLAI